MPVQQSFEADLQPLFDAEWSTTRIWPPWYRAYDLGHDSGDTLCGHITGRDERKGIQRWQ